MVVLLSPLHNVFSSLGLKNTIINLVRKLITKDRQGRWPPTAPSPALDFGKGQVALDCASMSWKETWLHGLPLLCPSVMQGSCIHLSPHQPVWAQRQTAKCLPQLLHRVPTSLPPTSSNPPIPRWSNKHTAEMPTTTTFPPSNHTYIHSLVVASLPPSLGEETRSKHSPRIQVF